MIDVLLFFPSCIQPVNIFILKQKETPQLFLLILVKLCMHREQLRKITHSISIKTENQIKALCTCDQGITLSQTGKYRCFDFFK